MNRENVTLASRLLDLASESQRRKTEVAAEHSEYGAEIMGLEAEVKASRQRWRVLKSTASAIVAGSGVDWARDDGLRDVVLDPPDDEV